MGADRRLGDKGKGKGERKRYPNVSNLSHCFKVLCPEELVSSLMGHGGKNKDAIQAETGVRMVFSQRNEYFPGTRLRMVVLHHETSAGIYAALEQIVDRLVECGAKEQAGNAVHGESDFLGREPGEYVFRAAIAKYMSGAIIGPEGAKVKQIRELNRARVSIDKDVVLGHQQIKVIAEPHGLKSALVTINDFVQEDGGSEWFMSWAAAGFEGLMMMEDHGGYGGHGFERSPRRERERSPRRRDYEGGSGVRPGGLGASHLQGGGHVRSPPRRQEPSRSRDGDFRQEAPERRDLERRGHTHGGQPPAGPPPGAELGDAALLEAIQAAADEFPPGALELEYAVTCDLPKEKVSSLIGRNGCHIQEVRRSTGTKIHFEEGGHDVLQTMLIQGPLLNAYRAHAMMMKKYHETEREVQQPAAVKELRSQLEELQKQLEEVKGGGKSKGRGKSRP